MNRRELFLDALALLVLFIASSSAAAATIHVPGDYATIQEAIDAASPGDTIAVAAGTYNENPRVSTSDLTIIGDGPPVTRIGIDGHDGFGVMAGGTTIEGFTFFNNAPAGVHRALYFYSGFSGQTIRNCVFDGNGSSHSSAEGIMVRAGNVVLEGVEVVDWAEYGVDIYDNAFLGSHVVIRDCTFRDNGSFNLAVDRYPDVSILDSAFSGGGTSIAFFEDAGHPVTGGTVRSCTVTGARYDGIRLVADGVLVTGNEITGCSTCASPLKYGAIRVTTLKWPSYTADDNTVTGNLIHGNFGNGVLVDHGAYPEPAGNVFRLNGIFDNAFGFEAPNMTTPVLAEDNWWGSPSGPYHPVLNPGGLGNGAGDGVDFIPWLEALLLARGDVIPGETTEVILAGRPRGLVLLAQGSGLADPPAPTPWGNLYLAPPLLGLWPLGALPGSGVMTLDVTIPSAWQPGEEYFFQAAVGLLPGSVTRLTNPVVLLVEERREP